jgi:hypothetical protein
MHTSCKNKNVQGNISVKYLKKKKKIHRSKIEMLKIAESKNKLKQQTSFSVQTQS